MYDVVGIDEPNIDLTLNFDEFPKPDGFAPVQASSWQGGGKVATGLVAVARLGGKGAVLGAVGDDVYGRFLKKDFKDHGLDTGGLLTRKGRHTHMAVVLSDRQSAGRCVAWVPGDAEPLAEAELPEGYLENTRFFFMADTGGKTVAMARKARGAGAKVVIDVDHSIAGLEACLDTIDVLIASEFAYNEMDGGANMEAVCRAVMEKGPEIAVFTLGSRGCVGAAPEGTFRLPAFSVDVVDTVGAGDVFHGAFMAGLLQGWNAEKTARFASAVSAIKCTRIGGRAGIPDMPTTLHFLETGQIKFQELDKRVEHYSRGLNDV